MEVTPLTAPDHAAAAALLARAFRDNPGFVAILGPDPALRLQRLDRLMPVFVATYAKHGLAWVVREGERLAGVALISPPGAYPPSLAMELQLTLGVMRHLPLSVGARLAAADAIMRRNHVSGRHHYLFMLGVEPELQRKGHGGSLLRELARCAEGDGVPCYLETDRETSVRLYESHGFKVTHARTFARLNDLKLWFMLRA